MENVWLVSFVAIVQTTIPFVLILIIGKRILEKYWNTQLAQANLQVQRQQSEDVLRLKLGAFERLALLMERMHLPELALRTANETQTAKEMQFIMIRQIRSEFDHNLAQQIYISSGLWEIFTFARDETIKTITLVGASMPSNTTSNQFAKSILEFVMQETGNLPTQRALESLRLECDRFIKK